MSDGLRWTTEDLARYLEKRRKPVLSQPAPVQAPSTPKPEERRTIPRRFGELGGFNPPITERRLKYRNERTVIAGRTFDSKKEAERFCQLELLAKVGAIKDLECQPRYELIGANGEIVGHFTPDFRYFSVELGQLVVEDVKSPITRRETAYRLRKKVFEASGHGVFLTEI